MLVAVLLFSAGLILGWGFNAFSLIVSSALIFFGSIVIYVQISGFGVLQLMLLLAYLLAHQAGFLVGAYLSYERKN
jgi:hypothetical protein